MKLPFKLRLLPLFLGIVLMMISVRVGDMWLGVSTDETKSEKFTAMDLALANSGKASAQDATGEAGAPAVEGDIPTLEEADDEPAVSENGTPEGMAPAKVVDEDDYFSSGSFGDMSPGEIRLLHDLVARRETLNKREIIVREREALLRSAEQQLLDKQKQLVEIKKSIEELLKAYKKEQTDEAKRLVKIYTNMKPKSAAKIFNEMDMDTLVQVFRGMKERSIASIMAAMNAEKARLVTRELAEVDDVDGAEELIN